MNHSLISPFLLLASLQKSRRPLDRYIPASLVWTFSFGYGINCKNSLIRTLIRLECVLNSNEHIHFEYIIHSNTHLTRTLIWLEHVLNANTHLTRPRTLFEHIWFEHLLNSNIHLTRTRSQREHSFDSNTHFIRTLT